MARARRDAWQACVLRRAYDTGWLPADTVRNIRRILPAADGSRVDLWLWTGARIIDTCDRISVHGPVDAIAVHELVTAVQRRAWSSVIVTGSEEFKRAVAIGMAMAQPPGEIVNYVIPNDDQECITQHGHAS